MRFDDLDKTMRQFETSLDQFCPADSHLVLRLDGRGFTRLTKSVWQFERPFDLRFHEIMLSVCEHLMSCAGKTLFCYTQSDEAAFTAKIGDVAVFDCRVCPLPNAGRVSDYFRWRAEDAKRNALSAYCYWGLRDLGASPSEADERLHGLTGPEKRAFLRAEMGVDVGTLPEWQTQGAFAEWRDVPHTGFNPITNEHVQTTRRRLQWLDPVPEDETLAAKITTLLEMVE